MFPALAALAAVLAFKHLSFNSWLATHFLFSFDEGFYSRALIGTLLQSAAPRHGGSLSAIYTISGLSTLVLSLILAYLGFRYWKLKKNDTALLFALVLISSTGTISFFANTSGFFDQPGYILAIGTILLLPKVPRKAHWYITGGVSVVLVLIHEAQLLLVAPVMAACALSYNTAEINTAFKPVKQPLFSLLSIIPAAVTAFLIFEFGKLEYYPEAFNEKLANLGESADFPVSTGSLMVQFRTIRGNVAYTLDIIRGRTITTFLAFTALAPSGIAGYILLKKAVNPVAGKDGDKNSKAAGALIILYCFAPLLLVFFGHDYPRWMASVITNLFIAGIAIELNRKSIPGEENVHCGNRALKAFLLWTVIFSLAIGPISPTEAPETLTKIIEYAGRAFRMLF